MLQEVCDQDQGADIQDQAEAQMNAANEAWQQSKQFVSTDLKALCQLLGLIVSLVCLVWCVAEVDRWKLTSYSVPKIALIPYYHRFSQTELVGFIFRSIVDQTIDKTIVNDCKENEPKKIGLGKPAVIWD